MIPRSVSSNRIAIVIETMAATAAALINGLSFILTPLLNAVKKSHQLPRYGKTSPKACFDLAFGNAVSVDLVNI